MERATGFTVWLTGLSGAGKTTLAAAVAKELAARRQRVEVLDGDELRRAFSGDLGFDKSDRDTNVRRIGFIAELLARNGVAVLVAAIAPYRAVRDEVRQTHGTPFMEVYVDCPLAELRRRDTKGLYLDAKTGTVTNLTGVGAPYEPPESPELHIRTDEATVEEDVRQILSYLESHRLVPPAATR